MKRFFHQRFVSRTSGDVFTAYREAKVAERVPQTGAQDRPPLITEAEAARNEEDMSQLGGGRLSSLLEE